MTEIDFAYEPFKKIVVMEYMRFKTPDDLVRFLNVAAGGKPTGVYWANGVMFFYYPMTSTTEIVAKALIEDKTAFWTFVGYALMPDYKGIIETREKIMVPVIDVGSSSLFQKTAQWLKERP